MSEEKWLGRITKAEFGFDGYQEAMFGLSVTIESTGGGVGDFKGAWGIERSPHAKWTEEDRAKEIFEAVWFTKDILEKAKKQHVSQLKGVPVEVTCEDRLLKSWRILTEVL